jgi:hemerythrin-like domain-containing protein
MMTEHAIELLDKLIYEHSSGNVRTAELQQLADEALLLNDFVEAQDAFVPGRLDKGKGLDNLQEMMQSIMLFLGNHFDREENVLLEVIEGVADSELLRSFNDLISEHEYLRTRVKRVNELIMDLKKGGLTKQHWDSSAHDLRAYLRHTRKLLELHSASETALFLKIREHLMEKIEQGD